MNQLREQEKKVSRGDLIHKTNNYTYNLIEFRTLISFNSDICKINIEEANVLPAALLMGIMNFS